MPRFAAVKNGFRTTLALISLGSLAVAVLTAEGPPPTLPEMQKEIRAYLTKKAGRAPLGTAVPNKSPWVWCEEQYEAVPKQDPKVLYSLISEHLAIAEARFLRKDNVEERRKGLGMVSEACQCASHRIKDHWLAVKICEAHLMPHMEAADSRHWKYLGRQNLLEVIADVYAQANDPKKFIEVLKLILENAHNRNTADAARSRLAQMLAKQGEFKEAIRLLKEIDENEGVAGAKRLIPVFEKKLQAQKQ